MGAGPITAGFAAVLALALPVSAATFHVSPTGNDTTGNGSAGAPWLTVQKGATVAAPGDTVLALDGSYPEKVTTVRSGSPGLPITFKSANRRLASVHGFNVNHSYITLDGFDMPGNTATPQYSGVIEVYRGLTAITIINNYIHDFNVLTTKNQGIHFFYASNAVLATANVTITNNLLKNLSYQGMALICSNALVAFNWLEFFNSHDAIHCFGRKITISDNTFTNISTNPFVPDHTDIIQTFGDELVEAYEVVFERNLVVNCEAQLCQLEQKGRPNIRDWTFQNNIWANVRMAGNCDIENLKWLNNTFYRCTATTGGPILLNCNVKGCAQSANIRNNIFFECGSGQTVPPNSVQKGWYHEFVSTGYGPLVYQADYNFVCGPGGAGKGSNFTANGHEAHGVNGGDPRFRDPSSFDFHLSSGSSCAGTGANLTSLGITADFYGTPRSSAGPWDQGAVTGSSPGQPPAPSGLRAVLFPSNIY